MAVTIAELRTEFGAIPLDLSSLIGGAKSIAAHVANLTITITEGIASGGTTLIVALGKAAIDATVVAARKVIAIIDTVSSEGSQIAKISRRLGLPAEDVSALGYAAEYSGLSLEDWADSMSVFARNLSAARSGADGGAEIFQRLGVSLSNDHQDMLSLKEAFFNTAEAIKSLPEDQQIRIARRLFGDDGDALLPMLRQGKQGILALMERVARLGATWSTEQANTADALRTALADVWDVWESMVRNVTAKVIPNVTSAIKVVTAALNSVRDVIKKEVLSLLEPLRLMLGSLISAFESIFSEGGSLDACLRSAQALFQCALAAVEVGYNVVCILRDNLKRFYDGLVNPGEVAKQDMLRTDSLRAREESQIYGDMASGKTTMADLSSERRRLVIRKLSMGPLWYFTGFSGRLRLELIDEIIGEHKSWKSHRERKGRAVDEAAWRARAAWGAETAWSNSQASYRYYKDSQGPDHGKRIKDAFNKYAEHVAGLRKTAATRHASSHKNSESEKSADVRTGATIQEAGNRVDESVPSASNSDADRNTLGKAPPTPTARSTVQHLAAIAPGNRPIPARTDGEHEAGPIQNITINSSRIAPRFNLPAFSDRFIKDEIWPMLLPLLRRERDEVATAKEITPMLNQIMQEARNTTSKW